MRSKIFRIVAGMVSVLLLAGTPIQADPVTMNDILQIVDGYQSPAQLNLRSLPQAGKPISENGTSLLAGVEVSSDEPQTSVQTIQGDVDVTICDCGEILVAGGGFPKWPLLFLAGIPLFFPHGHDTPDIPPFTPPIIPTPSVAPSPQTPVPEPSSLLLLGSGLMAFGAVLRKRYAGMKMAARANATEEAN